MNKFLKSISLYSAIALMIIFTRFLYKRRRDVVMVVIFSFAFYQIGFSHGEKNSEFYMPKMSKKEQARFDKEKASLIADLEKVAGKF